jgi:hypothetical protein
MALFGFDSSGFVMLGKVMGDWVGKELSPVIVYKYTTIREVAGFLARGADEAELSAVPADDKVGHAMGLYNVQQLPSQIKFFK